VHGLVKGLTPLVAGPEALVATAGMSTAVHDSAAGVSAPIAIAHAGIDMAATGIGFRLPVFGGNLATRVATGVAGNVALADSSAYATHALLEASGNHEQAQNYAPGDLTSNVIAALQGAVFGGVHHLSLPSQRDAVLTVANAEHYQQGTMPGEPLTHQAVAEHTANLDSAFQSLLDGKPVNVPHVIDPTQYNLHPDIAQEHGNNYRGFERALESNNRADAKNPLSSATGIDQFTEGTWLNTVSHAKPAWADGLDREQLLAARLDPTKSGEIAAQLDHENAAYLKRAGVPVDNYSLYAAHHFGPAHAVDFARASGDTPMADILTPAQMEANPYLAGKTKAEAVANWDHRAAKAGIAPGGDRIAEADIVNPIDPHATPEAKLEQIHALTAENKPLVDSFLKDLDAALGTESKSSVKEDAKILDKAQRPSILAEQPWHDIEHVRDTLRFKTVIDRVDQLPAIADALRAKGWDVVKVDTAKMENPKEWGWRFAALDVRMPNGQIVEHYMPLRELETVKEQGHKIFEKWRNVDISTLNPKQLAARAKDVAASNKLYSDAYKAALTRSGEAPTAVRASLDSFAAISGEARPKASSSTLPVMGNGGFETQGPDTGRNAKNPSDPLTTAIGDPESATYTLSGLSMGDSSNGIVPKSSGPVALDPTAFPIQGAESKVVTERGQTIPVRWAVVEASSLVTSHDDALHVNPDYPAELQPRDRTRAASEQQITKIANAINPDLLGESPKAADGAPIIGVDKVVESGNARTIALRRAYARGKADAYASWLQDNAKTFGVDPEAIAGLREPVLVRVAEGHDRADFARQANESSVARMSAPEQAMVDAQRMPDLAKLVANDDGTINRHASADFIRDFNKTISPADQAEMMLPEGGLSQAGQARIRNAVFAKAYGDPELVGMLAESIDVNVKNVLAGMLRVSANMAKLREEIANGNAYPIDNAPALVAAVRKFSQLRSEGTTVDQFFAQGQMFDDAMNADAKNLLRAIDKNARAPKQFAEYLQRTIDNVENLGDPRQGDLMGGKAAPDAHTLLAQAAADTEAANVAPVAGSLFGASGRPTEAAKAPPAGAKDTTTVSESGGVTVSEKPSTSAIGGDGDVWLQAASDAGYVGGHVANGELHINASEVAAEKQGYGHGVALYSALLDEAFRRGLTVRSDATVSAQAVRVYEALARRGYSVEKVPGGGSLEDGGVFGPSTGKRGIESIAGAYAVKPKITPENRAAYEAIAANPDMMIIDETGQAIPAEQFLASAEADKVEAGRSAQAIQAVVNCALRNAV
jgi:ribosomal protein S18 acetylase RimI-like enzyme